MKQPVSQIRDFFKKHKHGRMVLALLLILVVMSSALLYRPKPEEEPIALSEVATAISAGEIMRIEDSQDSGILTIYYTDGSKHITFRDKTASFLEQMQLLRVSNSAMAGLEYEIVETKTTKGEKAVNIGLSIAMLSVLALLSSGSPAAH
jgi:hypothetical protein